jgi:hypothetical protein
MGVLEEPREPIPHEREAGAIEVVDASASHALVME